MIDRRLWLRILTAGGLLTATSLLAYLWSLRAGDAQWAGAVAFNTVVFGQMLMVLAMRSEVHVLWQLGLLSNLKLVVVVVATIVLQVAIHYFPFTRQALHLARPAWSFFFVAMGLALLQVSILEVAKLIRARTNQLAVESPRLVETRGKRDHDVGS